MATTQTLDFSSVFEEFMAGMRELRKSQEETAQQLKETARRQAETERQIKERQAETERLMKERHEETERLIQEITRRQAETDRQMKETDRQMKETDKRLGGIANRFGEVVEYMVRPNLAAKFEELGFAFTKSYPVEIADRKHNIFVDVDAVLENGDTVMIVEMKNKPNNKDIDDHIERMEKMRKHADLHNDKRKYLGAMAGVVFSESAKTYALKKGFYVIEPSGETFVITEPRGTYHPQVW
jgi:hypothetical protein